MSATLGGGLLVVWSLVTPGDFPGRQTEPELIALGPRCRKSCSARAAWTRTTRPSALEREERRRRHLQPPTKSWRVDETDGRVKGRWCDLSRALDSPGATIDVVLSGVRDAAAAPRLCRKALTGPSQPQPRGINPDHARLCGAAISGVNKEGLLRPRCRPRPIHIREPHPGAGSSSAQTTRDGHAGLS